MWLLGCSVRILVCSVWFPWCSKGFLGRFEDFRVFYVVSMVFLWVSRVFYVVSMVFKRVSRAFCGF